MAMARDLTEAISRDTFVVTSSSLSSLLLGKRVNAEVQAHNAIKTKTVLKYSMFNAVTISSSERTSHSDFQISTGCPPDSVATS